ncbi:UNVERIFIED_CONTAM: hypothetical protein K2H54_012930 [Gekko kuhli]
MRRGAARTLLLNMYLPDPVGETLFKEGKNPAWGSLGSGVQKETFRGEGEQLKQPGFPRLIVGFNVDFHLKEHWRRACRHLEVKRGLGRVSSPQPVKQEKEALWSRLTYKKAPFQ